MGTPIDTGGTFWQGGTDACSGPYPFPPDIDAHMASHTMVTVQHLSEWQLFFFEHLACCDSLSVVLARLNRQECDRVVTEFFLESSSK